MNWRKVVSYLVLIVGWFLIGFFVRGLNLVPVDPLDRELALLRQAGQAISAQSFTAPPPTREMTYAAIRGLLTTIDDRYAEFWDPQTAARFSLENQGQDAVLGMNGEMRDGQFVVTIVAPGQPAEQAGLKVDDIVLEVDDWTVTPGTVTAAVIAMIRGPLDSTAHLVVRRGDQTLTFDVPRKPAVDITTRMLDSNIAYLRLDRFTTETGQEMEKAVNTLMADNPSALIWDLRFNGGGSMDATRESLDLFLDQGMAFYARLRDGTLVEYPTASGGPAEKIPLVVLIGPHTYSAPETVAASIQDRQRGILIGDKTHGKGSIITTVDLSDGSAIRFTVARWLSPVSQLNYEGKGVPADIVVPGDPTPDRDPVLQAALDYLHQAQP
jgi:carboxyl-terminal processing protease